MASITLGSDALVITPGAGQVEYNGTILTTTPLVGQRGIVPAEQFFMLNAAVAGANVNTAQSILGLGTGVTLTSNTVYEFEMNFALQKTAGVTAHTVAAGFAGTATFTTLMLNVSVGFNTTPLGIPPTLTYGVLGTAASTVVTGSTTSATVYLVAIYKGTFVVNAGGTLLPQYTLSAAPGGAYSTLAGSYMKIKPLGVSGANINVGSWS